MRGVAQRMRYRSCWPTVQALPNWKPQDVMVFHTALPRANTLYQQNSLLPHLPEFLLHISQGQMAPFKDHRPSCIKALCATGRQDGADVRSHLCEPLFPERGGPPLVWGQGEAEGVAVAYGRGGSVAWQ